MGTEVTTEPHAPTITKNIILTHDVLYSKTQRFKSTNTEKVQSHFNKRIIGHAQSSCKIHEGLCHT